MTSHTTGWDGPTSLPTSLPTLPAGPVISDATLTEDGLVAGGVLPDSALAEPAAGITHLDQATVERCFGFMDLCGFTSFTAEAGADAAVATLREFRDVVRTVAAARGVRIAKWLGDGCMVVGVAPGPVVATLAECSLRSQSPTRAGVAAGPALLFEADDHIGASVNLASRLCDLAAPDEVLVAPEVVPYCPTWTVARQAPDVEIRGIGKLHGVHSVTVAPEVASRIAEEVDGQPTDLFDRLQRPQRREP